jgi:prephenate dehydratase
MKLYFQGEQWAYSNITALEIAKLLWNQDAVIQGVKTFEEIWEHIQEGGLGVLPIENSYAGPIHTNLFAFSRFDAAIIGSYDLEVRHCLLSLESDISHIKKALSHTQALDQCYHFLKARNIEAEKFYDTAGAAKYIYENKIFKTAAIASKLAAEIYGLNILQESIQDQLWNTTRFLVVCRKQDLHQYDFSQKSGKITLIFETRNIPASLYKCLGAFATNGVNLSKIENLPSFATPFSSIFWIDVEGSLEDDSVIKSLEELKFFTSDIRILGAY